MYRSSSKASLAAAVLLAGAGFVHAQKADPPAPLPTKDLPAKKVTHPAKLHLPVLWPEIGQEDKEATLTESARTFRKSTPVGQRAVAMQVLCVRVPAGFCERAGLKAAKAGDKQPATGMWTLGKREAQMFGSLLRSETGKQVLSCPQLVTQDGKGAGVELTPPLVTVGLPQVVEPGGPTSDVVDLATCEAGLSLHVTPDVSADGKFVKLKATVKCYCLAQDTTAPSAVQDSEGTLVMPSGGTAVLLSQAGCRKDASDKKTSEVVWVLTAHVVEGRRQAPASENIGQKPAPSNPTKP
jgi:hypothetical protein